MTVIIQTAGLASLLISVLCLLCAACAAAPKETSVYWTAIATVLMFAAVSCICWVSTVYGWDF